MPFVKVAWLYGPDLKRPMPQPTWEDLFAALEVLGTPVAHTLHMLSRWNLDCTHDIEMRILGWEGHFHIEWVDNNDPDKIWSYGSGNAGAVGEFMFPLDGDCTYPLAEVLHDRRELADVARQFWQSGTRHDEQRWHCITFEQ